MNKETKIILHRIQASAALIILFICSFCGAEINFTNYIGVILALIINVYHNKNIDKLKKELDPKL